MIGAPALRRVGMSSAAIKQKGVTRTPFCQSTVVLALLASAPSQSAHRGQAQTNECKRRRFGHDSCERPVGVGLEYEVATRSEGRSAARTEPIDGSQVCVGVVAV